MDEQTRRTGLDIIGDVPWGTHFCHFYRTKHELIDVLVPYFKAGLESNEFCMWVTSEPLVEQDARKAMSEAIPDFDRYLKTGQIEIMPHDRWYLKDGVFDSERVLRGWVDKLDSALSRGYAGLRLTGNTAWLEKKDWASFADYEAAVTSVIGKHKMVALCSYWLEKCSAAEVIEAARSHAFAIVSHNGNPELVEGALHRQTREALAQLRASEERNRLLVENATEGIVVIQDGEIVFANSQVTEVIGHSEPGQPSRTITELIHPDDRQMVTESLLGMLGSQGRPGIFSFRIINQEGNERWVEANMAPFTWDGRPAVLSYVSDITERKLTEMDLKIKDSAMATSINGIVILDLEGKVTYVNPSFLRIWGFDSEKEVLGKSLLEITDASQKAEAAALMQESRQKGMWQGVLEGMRFKDGARYAVLLSANTVTNEAGKPTHSMASFVDIADLKRSEEELKASEERYRLLIDNATEGIVVIQDGKYGFVNPRFSEISGYSEEELTSRPFMDLIHPDDWQMVRGHYLRRMSGEETASSYPLRMIHKEGQTRWLEANVVALTWQGRPAILALVTDITERKKAEEALRASEERYRLLVDNAYEGIGVFGDGKVVFANPQLAEIVGFSKEELASMPFLELIHPDDRQIVTERYIKRLKGEEILSAYAVRAVDKAGNVKWVEANSALLTWNGRPAILGLVTDITNRKRAEEELRESEKRYRLLFDVTPVVTSITTPEGRALAVNNAIREMSGYTPEEFVTLNMNDIYVDPGERRRMHALLQREGRVRDFETVFRRKDGLISIVLLNADTIELDNQRLVLATVRDITERKRTEETLAESEKRYRFMAENVSDVIWAIDTNLRLTYLSPSITKMNGYSVEENMARGIEKSLSPASLEAVSGIVMRELAKKGRPNTATLLTPVTAEIEHKDGSKVWADSAGTLLRGSDGQPVEIVGVLHDVTEHKQAEEIRRTFYNRLVDVQEKERQTLARELHDEIGQPLIILKLYLDTHGPKAAGDIDPQLEQAREVLQELLHLVRNMSVNLRPTMLDDLGLLPTLLWHFERYTRQTKISVNFRHTGLKRQLPPEVASTAYRLVQEALTNVFRHAQVSEVMVHVRARGNSLTIEVRDHGTGFDLSKVAGKGIGLTGMYERALALNGTLTIESTPGTGTCLLAKLPLPKGKE